MSKKGSVPGTKISSLKVGDGCSHTYKRTTFSKGSIIKSSPQKHQVNSTFCNFPCMFSDLHTYANHDTCTVVLKIHCQIHNMLTVDC